MRRQWFLIGGGVLTVSIAVIAIVVAVLVQNDEIDASELVPANAHILGSNTAPVTMVEFGDFR